MTDPRPAVPDIATSQTQPNEVRPPKVRVVRSPRPKVIVHDRGVVRFVEDREADTSVALVPPPIEPGMTVDPALDRAAEIDQRAVRLRSEQDQRFAELAVLIAGADHPVEDWLLAGLVNVSGGIAWAIQKAEAHPSREALRTQLQTALDAARSLRVLLHDTTVLRVLLASSEDDLAGDQQAYHGLGSLIGRIEKALPAIREGKGSDKYDPGTNSPEAACALSVAFAWRRVRGSLPAHTAQGPREACRLLWSLAGGKPAGWGDNLAGWRVHLRRAKEELTKGSRPEVERLFESSGLHAKHLLAAFCM